MKTLIYKALITPLELIFEFIFSVVYSHIHIVGISIIVMSLVVNILILPLYNRADEIQEKESLKKKSLEARERKIRKTFKGDERFMMLQTYYRQNDYKPIYVLRGSLSLLLEIPFFIAAYHFLSHLAILDGMSFGPLKDLGMPDAMFSIGGFTVNIMPILMTVINLISASIFLSGKSVRDKVQTVAMALVFLVLLYTSPSGLVLYWTCNNIFSLFKNIYFKLFKSKKMAEEFSADAAQSGAKDSKKSKKSKAAVETEEDELLKKNSRKKSGQADKTVLASRQFFLAAAFFIVFLGVFIPASIIVLSPEEFVEVGYVRNPIWYIIHSFVVAAGTFGIWYVVFYSMMREKGRSIFACLMWLLLLIAFGDYVLFSLESSNLNSLLQYSSDGITTYTALQYALNILMIVVLIVVGIILYKKLRKVTVFVTMILMITLTVISIKDLISINSAYDSFKGSVTHATSESSEDTSENCITFSKNGQNVMVFMLDRAMASYIPYIMEERPDLREEFEGFTYYSNTISHGAFTNFGTPGIYGGYEYVPEKMNERDGELLVDKHNEALLVMPTLFSDAGFDISIMDPPYANYNWISDLSIYDGLPSVHAFNTNYYTDPVRIQVARRRNFYFYSIFRSVPLFLKPVVYSGGSYNELEKKDEGGGSAVQTNYDLVTSSGDSQVFMKEYLVMSNLENLTVIEDEGDNLLLLQNSMTHEPIMLQKPEYTPQTFVDNSEADQGVEDQYVIDGRHMLMTDLEQRTHYQTNMSVMLCLAKWFDYLREQGVYDNTRIILVADHGKHLDQFDDMIYGKGTDEEIDLEWFHPLLMVKDFNATGEIQYSDEFMTNADVPTLATNGVISNPTNPFTGNPINSDDKANDQKIIFSEQYETDVNNGTTFLPGMWYSVHDDIMNHDFWSYLGEY